MFRSDIVSYRLWRRLDSLVYLGSGDSDSGAAYHMVNALEPGVVRIAYVESLPFIYNVGL